MGDRSSQFAALLTSVRQRDPEVTWHHHWAKVGVLIGMAHLLVLLVLTVLLDRDPALGIVFAVVASLIGGIVVVVYALRKK